jgi:hypothetical protein
MSIITTKQHKRQGIVDPIFILFFVALFILSIFAVSTGDVQHVVEDVLESMSGAPASLSVSNQPSVTIDQRYWAANCSEGWSSDLMCDTIVTRTQSCSISDKSVYCSDYKNYLQTVQ